MQIVLRPETARRIRDVLGDDVELLPGAVPSALARLAVEAPAVYSQVLAELSGTQIRLDSERALERKRRWSALRRLLFWWGEYDSDVGDRLVAKRHVAAAVPLGLAGLILVLLAGSALFGHRGPRATATVAAAPLATHGMPRRAAVARPPAVPLLPPVPPFPDADGPSLVGGAAPLVRASAEPPNPLVFNREASQVAAGAAGTPPAPGRAAASASVGPGSPIVYDRFATDAATSPAPVEHSAALPGGAGTQGPVSRWAAGQRVVARLVTGIVAVSGGPSSPAIAQTADPAATWLGQATLGADGRVQVLFTLAGQSGAVRGVALDPDRLVPGLLGHTELRHPQAAGAALKAAAQAAADYARALAQQGQLTLAGGWAGLALGQPGPAWAYLASSLADGIAPRSSVSGPVETSEVAAGAPLVILLTEVP